MNLLQSRRVAYLDDDVIDLLAATQSDEDPEMRQARRRALPNCLKKLSTKDQELVPRSLHE